MEVGEFGGHTLSVPDLTGGRVNWGNGDQLKTFSPLKRTRISIPLVKTGQFQHWTRYIALHPLSQ